MSAHPLLVEAVFFDLDDCLYKNDWATTKLMREKMTEYVEYVLGAPEGTTEQLLQKYGCVLKGLICERFIYERRVYEYRSYPYQWFSLSDVKRDPRLRDLLLSIPHPRWIYTNHPADFANRILKRIGIEDLFAGIISTVGKEMISEVGYCAKHEPKCLFAAMKLAHVLPTSANGCVLLDDNPRYLKTAREMNWRTVLVGRRDEAGREIAAGISCADVAVDSVHQLREAMPGLFEEGPPRRRMKPSSQRDGQGDEEYLD